jgi:N-acetylneuraminate synthase
MSKSIFIIAEAGVNHNGEPDLAFKLVDAAAEAGVDAVKFQTFNAVNLATKIAKKANYQQSLTASDESQLDMLKRLELTYSVQQELFAYCNKKGIHFLSTPFDKASLRFLVKNLGLKMLKISSGDLTDAPLLLESAKSGCKLMISTGMATLGEVEEALSVIAFGLLGCSAGYDKPSRSLFWEAYKSPEGKAALSEYVTLLHCTTEYPAPLQDINLKAMEVMRKAFGLSVGYSDHSVGITVPVVAASLGATIIEKHFTLDRSLPGPDHRASLSPEELKEMVWSIRTVEEVLGDGRKSPMASEFKNRGIARKSLIAACDIKQGDIFTENNLVTKRPGTGVSPMKYWEVLGQASPKDYSEDEIIN